MKHILNKTSFVVFIACLLFSCAKQWSGDYKLPKLKEKAFTAKMDSLHALTPKYFYSKIKVSYTDDERSVSFKTSVNVSIDSAMSAILSYAAIPIFTAYLDTGQITIVNKKDKCFTNKQISHYSELWGVEFSFKNIQELIFGLPIGYLPKGKYHVINDPYVHTLSSHKKREQKKSEKRHRSNIIYTYKLNANADQLVSTHINSPADSFKIDILYKQWQEKEQVNFPKEMLISLRGPKSYSQIKMVFNKLKINQSRRLFMIIPESYEACN
tara:strand:- start:1085 stop:1891 length:807 start_codon:yes stop_codon:yes gene_type:complete